ncbi:amidohydrolase family protein [Balneolales bacterium ANBcel1]|nr:amidohydrolase family protein [Balneolales bacterium ANBcel1]
MKKAFSLNILIVTLVVSAMFATVANAQNADEIYLKDYRPQSIYNTPQTYIEKAAFPVIDVHSHPYANSPDEVARWTHIMDELNIRKTVILTNAIHEEFDSLFHVYNAYPEHFEVWCGLDVRDFDSPDYADRAIAELERCHSMGGKGIGELSDKGWGVRSGPMTGDNDHLPHVNDPALRPVFRRAAELGMPVNIHVADPLWMYQPMDETNDGLMVAWRWRLDNRENIIDHSGMMDVLEDAVRNNPETIFIACHYANLSYDLNRLGEMLDNYPNLYADISARFSEIANIPRFVKKFFIQYQDRLLYGTDLGYNSGMYRTTFRILESADEHFYDHDVFQRHWSLNGLNLPDEVLEKVYYKNAKKLFERLRQE